MIKVVAIGTLLLAAAAALATQKPGAVDVEAAAAAGVGTADEILKGWRYPGALSLTKGGSSGGNDQEKTEGGNALDQTKDSAEDVIAFYEKKVDWEPKTLGSRVDGAGLNNTTVLDDSTGRPGRIWTLTRCEQTKTGTAMISVVVSRLAGESQTHIAVSRLAHIKSNP